MPPEKRIVKNVKGLMAVSSRKPGFIRRTVAGVLTSEERFLPVSPRCSSEKRLRMNVIISGFLVNLIFRVIAVTVSSSEVNISCSYLQLGQYKCDSPQIDPSTQQPVNCSSQTLTAPVACRPAPGIFCDDHLFTGEEIGFVVLAIVLNPLYYFLSSVAFSALIDFISAIPL
ncbi:hypothetical protein P879_10825 [Paragonimus westermani]|uniref:Uncharacterized protein n=1 Tax=Paragonimus westermani TaxID=34504 RepID=A0A8T0DPR9_9TREM|nr:hypothetical protein P879_10825 [Paragonimus westermani]